MKEMTEWLLSENWGQGRDSRSSVLRSLIYLKSQEVHMPRLACPPWEHISPTLYSARMLEKVKRPRGTLKAETENLSSNARTDIYKSRDYRHQRRFP